MKKGFTLLELMIVVLLMGIVYGLVINVFQDYKEKSIDVTLMNLEKYMQNFSQNNHVSLVCIKQCKECLLLVNGKFKHNVTPFVDDEARLYRYDHYSGIRDLQLQPYFRPDGKEEKVCFRYDIGLDGSRSEMIVETGTAAYVYPSYFGSVKKYNSIKEVIAYYNESMQKAGEL